MTTPKQKNGPKFETLELQDGTTVELKPLPISGLRRFMIKFNEMNDLEYPDPIKIMDILVDCSATAMRKQRPEETAYLNMDPNADDYEEWRDKWGDLVTMDDVSKINSECGGVDFNNPNLQAGEPEAETPEKKENEEDGETST